MSAQTDHSTAETGERPRWRLLGPGLIVAATGVGGADLVATLVAGSKYGYALLWAVVLGCLMKVVLVEGAGRYTLATGRTIYEGWSSLGRWTHFYFGPYVVIWGLVYGAAAMAGTGLALHALFPVLGVKAWGILSAVLGAVLVWTGKYSIFEKTLSVLVLLMFCSMLAAAAATVPNLAEIAGGFVPVIPEGGLLYMLGVAGGVGGTITLAAYGYWLRDKGWDRPAYMRVMRLDNATAYTVTGLFVIATLIVGAELLYSAGIAVSTGDRGLVDLALVLEDRYGGTLATVFLVGFWAAATSSLVGVWNGVSLMFADFVGHVRGLGERDPDRLGGGRWYRAYVLWLTFPPIALLFFGEPVYLILVYGVLGAIFMPFLAITLLWILNTDRVPAQHRNRAAANVVLAVCALAFLALAVDNVRGAVAGVL